MRTSKSLFHVARVLFGTSHLILQTGADLCVEAEVACYRHTGFGVNVESEDGTITRKMMKFGDDPQLTEQACRDARRATTKNKQEKVKLSLEQARDKVAKLRANGTIKRSKLKTA